MPEECGHEPDEVEAQQVADAQRDPRRFAVLYEDNVDEVYAFVSRRVGCRADAEDVTATVFHKALANLHRFEWRGVPFVAWLMRIASNELADWARQRARALPEMAAQSRADLDVVERRAAARAARDYATSDELRDRLAELGYSVVDTPSGQTVSRSRDPGDGRSGR